MKSLFVVICLLTITLTGLGQTSNYNSLISGLKFQYKNTAASSNQKSIFVNKLNKILDIEGHQISLDSVNVVYFFDGESKLMYQNKVKFICISGNCMLYNVKNEKVSALGIAFKSKKACYDFINILAEIKKSIEND